METQLSPSLPGRETAVTQIAMQRFSDNMLLLLIGGGVALFHILTNGQHGFHRDELDIFRRIKMFTHDDVRLFWQRLTISLVTLLLLSACADTGSTSTQPDPVPTSVPVVTTEPMETAVPTTDDSLQISLDTGSMATGFDTETVMPSAEGPYWEVLPAYTRLTLQGYPIRNHLLMPQIFIYPVEELVTVNESAERIAASLQTLIESPQEITPMPFLPLLNAQQVIHAHVQYLDFQNGQGLRYLTQFDQAFIPINNNELIYTYQGLTSDGKYYVAAVLPVNHPSLPNDGAVTGNEPPEFTSDFPTYLANMVASLNPQAAYTFTPDLTQLDAMMRSLEVK